MLLGFRAMSGVGRLLRFGAEDIAVEGRWWLGSFLFK